MRSPSDPSNDPFSRIPPLQIAQPVPQPAALQRQYVDIVAMEFGVESHVKELNLLYTVGSTLPRDDLGARLISLAAVLRLGQQIESANTQHLNVSNMLQDLAVQLDSTFKLSAEQKVSPSALSYLLILTRYQENIRRISQSTMFDCTRITWHSLQSEVAGIIFEDRKSLNMTNAYQNPARKDVLGEHIKSQASHARNKSTLR